MNPVMPSSFRACSTALHHLLRPPDLNFFLAPAAAFLETIFPRLFSMRSFFTKPPFVYILVPFQTWRIEPVCIFFVMRFGFFAFLAFFFDLRRGARGLLAVRLRDLLRERDFLAPRGVAARRRLRLLLLDFDLFRERLVEARERLREVERERDAARGFDA